MLGFGGTWAGASLVFESNVEFGDVALEGEAFAGELQLLFGEFEVLGPEIELGLLVLGEAGENAVDARLSDGRGGFVRGVG